VKLKYIVIIINHTLKNYYMADEIQYKELREVLECQVEDIGFRNWSKPSDIELIVDLRTRTINVFDDICDGEFYKLIH